MKTQVVIHWLFIKAEHTHNQLVPRQKVWPRPVPALSEVQWIGIQATEDLEDQVACETEHSPQAGVQATVPMINILAFVDIYLFFLAGCCALECMSLNPVLSL